ncbi:ABC transporter substrate-binding protein [Undibacterium sp. Jales W-56]|uniref:substrate-binding periplasmic protein n=1 Tax=Undibacterium sp. Jales W-56 TaxID=2897325 RepID=UPI0021D2BDDC|nr:ABC transporter substrate-binding protein [Undibacterium sp. Jales W-56]MCU6432963.1 ABC transporter substrate-binding protein [Undibacterium sp. Jales W-56]
MKLLRLFALLSSMLLMFRANAELIIHVSPIPPYVLDGPRRGIACDIIEQAFATQSVKIKFVISNNKRMEIEVQNGTADAGFAGIPADSEHVYFSDPVIEFDNIAVTLSNRNLHLNRIMDLANKRVIAFRNAQRVLGPEFAKAAQGNPLYIEVGDQRSQLPMLEAGRGDVIVMDRRAFLYFAYLLHGKKTALEEYTVHPIFKPLPRTIGFKQIATRDLFNKGLKTIRDNGIYTIIVRSYLSD